MPTHLLDQPSDLRLNRVNLANMPGQTSCLRFGREQAPECLDVDADAGPEPRAFPPSVKFPVRRSRIVGASSA